MVHLSIEEWETIQRGLGHDRNRRNVRLRGLRSLDQRDSLIEAYNILARA